MDLSCETSQVSWVLKGTVKSSYSDLHLAKVSVNGLASYCFILDTISFLLYGSLLVIFLLKVCVTQDSIFYKILEVRLL